MNRFFLFLQLLFLLSVNAQNSGMVAGVGYGVFIIIFGFVISIIISIFSRATRYPIQISFLSLLIPVILIIFFTTAPREKERLQKVQNQEFAEDFTVVVRWLFFTIFFITFLFALFFLLSLKCFRNRTAVKVGTLTLDGKRGGVARKNSSSSSSSSSSDGEDPNDKKEEILDNNPPKRILKLRKE